MGDPISTVKWCLSVDPISAQPHDAQGAHEVIEQVAALPIMVDRDTPGPAAILTLALRYDLTSYDAAYLELALHLQLPIATQDAALMEAARAAGVGLFKAVGQ